MNRIYVPTNHGGVDNGEQPLKVLIAGGGIGGLAAAIFLRHAGHSVEVHMPPIWLGILAYTKLDLRVQPVCIGDRSSYSPTQQCQWFVAKDGHVTRRPWSQSLRMGL